MAEVAAPQIPQNGMEGVVPTPPPQEAAAPAALEPNGEPELVSETLYIQNLNEKIKPDGASKHRLWPVLLGC